MVNPAPLTRISLGVATKVIGLKLFNAKNADVNEKESIYNLKVEVLDTDDSLYYPDLRIRENECGATALNMANSIYRQFDYDGRAPYEIELKNLVNKWGINNATGSDELQMHIYSDYLQKLVRVPNFEITNDELIVFDDVFIPCKNEMIISLVK